MTKFSTICMKYFLAFDPNILYKKNSKLKNFFKR